MNRLNLSLDRTHLTTTVLTRATTVTSGRKILKKAAFETNTPAHDSGAPKRSTTESTSRILIRNNQAQQEQQQQKRKTRYNSYTVAHTHHTCVPAGHTIMPEVELLIGLSGKNITPCKMASRHAMSRYVTLRHVASPGTWAS